MKMLAMCMEDSIKQYKEIYNNIPYPFDSFLNMDPQSYAVQCTLCIAHCSLNMVGKNAVEYSTIVAYSLISSQINQRYRVGLLYYANQYNLFSQTK